MDRMVALAGRTTFDRIAVKRHVKSRGGLEGWSGTLGARGSFNPFMGASAGVAKRWWRRQWLGEVRRGAKSVRGEATPRSREG